MTINSALPSDSHGRATPFTKILIANRGEIALRVMRSAHAAGYHTVAVYSDADAAARHVREAEQAIRIGGPRPADSYLNIPALLDAARRSGADAVHPGYGFLAENAEFAQACGDAGLVFIGPSPAAIRAMGNKAVAKQLMQQASVPCVPGYQGKDQGEQRMREEAERIGFPLMIKAVSGGGGRGMRLVTRAQDFDAALRSAQSEAASAFGAGTVLLEHAIIKPRHIEIQVFADRHGNAIHLGERDCSVQRRHQKLIEESPSPAVSESLREHMGSVAVTAVKAIGYEGAGTLEFLLDDRGQFYFMEMNTRLQVEHPVTEAITGLDLVALQLAVAAGEPLPFGQHDIAMHGHAIEVRLCAEDTDANFLPQSGVLSRWQPANGIRIEHALADHTEISPFYDSMIAKLVAHGRSRDEARRRLAHALHELVALGVTTNQSFLRRCLLHPVFAAGGATTAFIADHQHQLLANADEPAQMRTLAIGVVLLRETDPYMPSTAERTLMPRLSTTLHVANKTGNHSAQLEPLTPTSCRVHIAATTHEISVLERDDHNARIECGGIIEHIAFARDGHTLHWKLSGEVHVLQDMTRVATKRADRRASDGRLCAAMNGRVVDVQAEPGQVVTAGQALVTLEAMKMEHVHVAPLAGSIKAVHVSVGDQVASRRIMIEIDSAPATTA